MRVAIVAEGPSDQILLERLVRSLRPVSDVIRVQPEPTLGRRGSGWKGVRAWCREFGPSLEDFMGADPERPIDVLIVHVDCSMAHNVGAQKGCPPAAATADELRKVVLHDWLRLNAQPWWLVMATPSTSSDTWIAAATAPPPRSLGPVECIATQDIERHLISRKAFKRKTNGQVAKPGRMYEALAEQAVARIANLRRACSQADRLCAELP